MHVLRRPIRVLVIVLTLVVGAAATGLVTTQTVWFRHWLKGYIEREANLYLNGQLTIERLDGNLFSGLELQDVLVSMNGRDIVAARNLKLRYSIWELISKGMTISEIELNQPVLSLRRDGDTWEISRLIKRQEREADRQGPTNPIAVRTIALRGASISIDQPVASGLDVPRQIDKLDAELSFDYQPVHYSIGITNVSFRGSDPSLALNGLTGSVAVRNDTLFVDKIAIRTAESTVTVDGAVQHYLSTPQFNVQLASEKLSLPEFSAIVPALSGIELQPSFDLKIDGPMDRLNVAMNVRSSAGNLSGQLIADVMEPGYSATGDLSVHHLDLLPWVAAARKHTDISGASKLDLRASSLSDVNTLEGTASVAAPRVMAAGYEAKAIQAKASIHGRQIDLKGRASAYGAGATAAGRITLQGRTTPLTYDLKGRVAGLNLRQLPASLNVTPADTRLTADYHVRGSEPPTGTSPRTVESEFRFDDSTVPGARIVEGSTAGVTMSGGDVSYQADATFEDVNLRRLGEAFDVPALAVDRYNSQLNGHLTASGQGTTRRDLRLNAEGTLKDSTVLGGQLPQLNFTAGLEHDTVHVTAAGDFAAFDPAVLSGKPDFHGTTNGTLVVDASLADISNGVSAETVEGTARLALGPSTIGGLEISKGNLDADYHNRTSEIRTLEITGRDLNVEATGTLALNETDHSNLKVHADSPSLETVARMFDVPMTGIGRLDATVTGNRAELLATGTLVGNSVKYQENGALTASADFTARVPGLDMNRAHVESDTHATFVTLAGQNINRLDAKTTYADKRVMFDATARQPERSLGVAGALELHPEHEEVHLERLALETRGLQWQLAPGSSAAVQYGAEAVTVTDLTLVSGQQQITASGTIGRSGDALQVTLTNVDLANVDAMLLRPSQLTGRINAAGSVSGTMKAPAVDAEFQVTDGGFREFRYDAFTGTVNYSGQGLTLDSRLQQNAAQWITAKGYVPTSVFRSTADDEQASDTLAHVAAPAPADRIDLVLDSSPIGLGIVQGFTTALTEVTGTLEAHVRVTGSAQDPHPEGVITIQNGAATVAAAGVHYTDIAGRIDLQPDRVHIDQIKAVDNHDSPLIVSGDVALHEREIGAVSLKLEADDFKVIDNEMGHVRVASRLAVTGELRSPRLEGSLDVTTGQLNLDELIALAGPSAYATKATEFETTVVTDPGQVPPPGLFEALQMDVTVKIPNDLIVKASDLRAGGAPIGMGALNVTLGGDLRASKAARGPVLLVGSVNTVRGTYDFQGRRFEILRDGAVRFDGTNELNPILDLRTRRLIQGVEARVNILGTLRDPEIGLSSTPPLEQADILSLIVFNQPINQLAEGQQISLAARAQALAAGALTNQIAQSIGGALHLDTFEVNLAPETGGGPQFTLGQQLSQTLYVKVEQGFGERAGTNVVLEYELLNWLRLQSNVLQNSSAQQSLFWRAQSTGADLIFFFSH